MYDQVLKKKVKSLVWKQRENSKPDYELPVATVTRSGQGRN